VIPAVRNLSSASPWTNEEIAEKHSQKQPIFQNILGGGKDPKMAKKRNFPKNISKHFGHRSDQMSKKM